MKNNSALSYIELSKENLLHNFKTIRSYINSNTKIASVVKANAYGHGLEEVVRVLDEVTDYFQVDDLLELKDLRKFSNKQTLVLGYVKKSEIQEAINLDAILCIYDYERLDLINKISLKLNKKALVHVKIDALLGRQGLLLNDIDKLIKKIKNYKNIELDGVYSHFANIEDTSDMSHAKKQIDAYNSAVKAFVDNGFSKIKRHISATSGILEYEKNKDRNNIVRPGIGLYGMWPSEQLELKHKKDRFNLRPVMRWVTHIAQVKTVPANYPIGYGLTYITPKQTKIAIIPQGYSDGYDRGLSNKGEVLVGSKRCRILGRVAMNMFVIDVSNVEGVKAEDEVVLLGQQGEEQISAEEIAEKTSTINYEVITKISPLLPRLLID